ncbi:MAG: hypothetical protein JSS57_17415 [Proteobacteria bacterium]|nr:hypothetical protein [Pseudomonadota bacterium]
MTTSPEALREAVERVASSVAAAKWPNLKGCDVYPEDLTLVLSALQEAREALGPFVEEGLRFEPECSDEDPWGAVLKVGHFRRAAEVHRAISHGGVDE